MTIELGLWIALAVALVVLGKVVVDFSRRATVQTPDVKAVLATHESTAQYGGIPVVARAERHLLNKVALQNSDVSAGFVDSDEVPLFAANEELETAKWVLQPEPENNVTILPTRTEVILSNDDSYNDDDDVIDPVASSSQSKAIAAQEHVILYVTAGRVPFDGERLLKAVSNYGLRFGEMGMFHRHEDQDGYGEVLFSMARLDNVGTFDLETMGSDFIQGVVLFLALPNPHAYAAFNIMVDTAKRIANEFCGEVLDQQQQLLNLQLTEHYREYVTEFTRRHLMKKVI